ncbi:MAG: ATP-binding protein [Eggerthellaceae bacterium]|nr:ATP-binding protein [Eggerthellaceae bacterium]
METTTENPQKSISSNQEQDSFDYSFVDTVARIARYDDFLSAPQITEVSPAPTHTFIENLTVAVYSQSQQMGGKVPYTIIREVSENFIHAQFKEIIVSILDKGNTIRFADQGPGIEKKDKAQLPGFSSATTQMKEYIRGVGSGLPIVREYLNSSHGTITIEDNLTTGAVITISLDQNQSLRQPQGKAHVLIPFLNDRQKQIINLLTLEDALGVTEITNLLNIPLSSTHKALVELEEAGIVEKTARQKRILTQYGKEISSSLS